MQGVGSARKARWAYASMAASQYRNFVLGRGFAWGIAAMLSLLKAILRSSPERRA
jgi:hypothetical protein